MLNHNYRTCCTVCADCALQSPRQHVSAGAWGPPGCSGRGLCPLGPALPGGGATRSTKGRLTRVRRRYSAHLTELVTPDLAQILPDCPRRYVQRLLLNGGYTRSAVHRCVPMGLPNSLGCSVGSTIYIKGPQRPCLVPVTEIRHLAVQRKKKKLENVTSEIFSEFPPRGPNIECALGAPPGASRHPSRAKLTSIFLSVTSILTGLVQLYIRDWVLDTQFRWR